METGITSGVEDGLDNSGVSNDKLYSAPEDALPVCCICWLASSGVAVCFVAGLRVHWMSRHGGADALDWLAR